MAKTADLPEFLLACIAEDEEVARAAAGDFPDWVDGNEETSDGENVYFTVTAARGPGKTGAAWEPDYFLSVAEDRRDAARVEHIARHDPARVLAECRSKRRIVESCRVDYEDSLTSGDDGTTLAEEVLHALALPYADHPGYREEWKP